MDSWKDAERESKEHFNPVKGRNCYRCEHSFMVTYGLWCSYAGCYVTPDNFCASFQLDDYLSLERKNKK